MKLLLLFLSIMCCSFLSKKDKIEVIEASCHSWVSGANGGKRGIEYLLKIKLKKNNLSFDSAWVEGTGDQLEISKGNVRNYKESLQKNDTVTVQFTEVLSYKGPDSNDRVQKTSVSPPRKYEGKALVRYYSGGKKNYFVVKEFKKTTAPLNK